MKIPPVYQGNVDGHGTKGTRDFDTRKAGSDDDNMPSSLNDIVLGHHIHGRAGRMAPATHSGTRIVSITPPDEAELMIFGVYRLFPEMAWSARDPYLASNRPAPRYEITNPLRLHDIAESS
jgi:hypothetical protein